MWSLDRYGPLVTSLLHRPLRHYWCVFLYEINVPGFGEIRFIFYIALVRVVAILSTIYQSVIEGLPAENICSPLVMRTEPLPMCVASWIKLEVVILFIEDLLCFPSRMEFFKLRDHSSNNDSLPYRTKMNFMTKSNFHICTRRLLNLISNATW